MPRHSAIEADVAVVGAGAAGLYAALCAAREGGRVTLISATPLAESASYWAQGGLAAALAADDAPELHLKDTVVAGRGAVRESAARVLCEEAPECARDLEHLGVAFDADRHGALALGLEGGHSRRRIVHAGGSQTGRRITRQLSALVAENPLIEVLERHRATAIWTAEARAIGVVCHEGPAIAARAVVLATGGAAALWSRTTNPVGAIGAGLTLALDAGAALADLELVQFHPTAVVARNGDGTPSPIDGFLVTEAIRGEGARLLDARGERFVDELAPRDEVARAIQVRMADSGADAVQLDMRDVDPTHFPNVASALRDGGIEPTRDLVPVAPAAHYVMGGIATDADGSATLAGLYAVGECACTGLHGANRLASNSLSECFVFGRRAARTALGEPQRPARPDEPPARPGPQPPSQSTRNALWTHAGLVRDADGLQTLLDDPYPLAPLIAAGALARVESRGAHQRRDAPATDPALDGRHAVVRIDAPTTFHRWT